MSAEYNPKSNVIFGDVDLSDYNAFAIYCNIFDRPERDVEVVSVPGRNGDLIFDNGRYKNLDRVYTIQVTGVQNVHNLINALTTKLGYQELEDEYDDTVYYVARLKNRPRVSRFVGNAVLLTVTFDRKPQTFLKSGRDVAITGTYIGKHSGDIVSFSWPSVGVMKIVINNPYSETMYPKIYVPGRQPKYSWGFWARQLNEDLSSPDGSKLDIFIKREDGDPAQRYADDEANGNYLLFHVQKMLAGSDGACFTEFDSESRSVTHGTSYNPQDTYNYQYTNVYRFPVIKPGNNYIYFMFRNYSTAAIGMNIAWENLRSPNVYARWWTI